MRASMRHACLALSVAVAVYAGVGWAGEIERWYPAALDHIESGLTVLVVQRADGTDWVRVVDLKLLGIAVPPTPPAMHQGEAIVPLVAIAAAQIDPANGQIHFHNPVEQRGTGDEEGAVELIVDMVVNGQAIPDPQIVRHDGGRVWLSQESIAAARLVSPQSDTDRNEWTRLESIAGEHYVLDPERLRLEFAALPDRFVPTRLDLSRPPTVVPASATTAPLAAIVAYDISAGLDAQRRYSQSLLMDAAISRGRSQCRSRHLGRSDQDWQRLDTQCIFDWPEQRLSLTLGDAASRGYALSGSVRYGGIRVGTDFTLQPQLQLQPLLSVEGSARLPSILEVWVEQRLATRTEVAPGEFLIDGVPAMTGHGEIDAVIIDALGRRTIVSAPYYAAPSLLRPGLSDWTLEAGRVRTGFLSARDRYVDPFALVNWRRGLTSWWTAQLRMEVVEDGGVGGLVSYVKLGTFGIAELATAKSRSGNLSGSAHALGYHYQGRRWSVGLRAARHSPDYRDIAYPKPGLAPLHEARASLGVRLGNAALSAGGHFRETASGERLKFARAGVTLPIANGYLSLSAFAPLDQEEDTMYTATYTLPLGHSRSVSAWMRHQDGETEPGVMLQRGHPAGLGHGYRLTHQDGKRNASTSLAASYLGEDGQIDLDVFHGRRGTDIRLSAQGAVLVTKEGVFPTQDDDGSFAVISLPEADVAVFRDNQLVSRTDSNGHAVVSSLRPYQRNHLQLDATTMSLSTRIESPELNIVPGRRQVVRADFQAETVRTLLLRLVRPDGTVVPAGAVARLLPDLEAVPVAFDGMLYLELTQEPSAIAVEFQGQALCMVPASALSKRNEGATHEILCEDTSHAQ